MPFRNRSTASMHIPQAPRVSVVAAGIDGTAEEPTTIETLHAASLRTFVYMGLIWLYLRSNKNYYLQQTTFANENVTC